MSKFNYRAFNNQGRISSGTLIATGSSDLEQKLQTMGLELIEFSIVNQLWNLGGKKISQEELIIFCIQLEQLEQVGVPLLDSLSDIRETATATMQNLLTDMIESIKHGSLLSGAMATQPQVFDNVFVGLVAVGEKSGQLANIFHHLSEHLKWNEDNRKRIAAASYYPIFLSMLLCSVVAIMMIFVIPKLTTFLQSQNIPMPFYTSALIATSDFIATNWQAMLATISGFYVTLRLAVNYSKSAARYYDRFKLSLPVIGNLISKIEISRFCRFFSITFKSGIDLIKCLEISSRVVNNKIINEAILEAQLKVLEGHAFHEAMFATNRFSSLVIRMIKIGEESGNLDNTLNNVNAFYDKEIKDAIGAMIALIQPVFTVILGMVMLWIAMSIFGPIYSSFDKMNF